MKINDRFLDGSMIQGELTEKTDGPSPGTAVPDPAPAELPEVRHPKADSVELKTNSFYNFDQAAKLDPTKTNIGSTNEVPAAMIPGVPFREKVELPKTLPNGTSVDNTVGSDLGFGKKHTGPNHMGIDMKGNEIRNQLDDALKLREGGQATTTAAPTGGTVNYNSLGGTHAREDKTYHAGLNNRPGMDKISADKDGKGLLDKAKAVADKVLDYVKDVAIEKFGAPGTGEAMTILDAPGKVQEVTGDSKDLVRGISATIYPESRLDKIYQNGDNKYVNPDAPEGNQPPVVTGELLHHVDLRFDSNKRPSNEDLSLGTIDASKLSTADPRWKLVSNPNPEADSNTATGTGESIEVMNGANGPDTVNPRDPDLGGGSTPIVFDPNRPK